MVIDTIHNASLVILSEIGLKVDHQTAIKLFCEAGGEYKNGRVYLPSFLIRDILEEVDHDVQLYNSDGTESLLLNCNSGPFFGPGSDALYQINLDGELQKTTLQDVALNVRLANLLDYDFVMSMGLPCDVRIEDLYPSVFKCMVDNTHKPIVATMVSLKDLQRIHQIALKKTDKPFFVVYLQLLSPLILNDTCVEKILYCANHTIPYVFASGANLGATAPISVEWGVVQGHAESLAGMVLGYLKNPNIKFICGSNTSSMDMRTSKIGYGAPEWAKTVGLYAELGRLINLPSWGTAGCSDSFCVDAQAGCEAYESILLAFQNGSTLVHDMGYLGHGELNDPAMHILVNQLVKRARFTLSKPNYSIEHLSEGMEVIKDVIENDGHYPSHDSTFDGFRDSLWIPPIYWQRSCMSEYLGKVNLDIQLRKIAKEMIYDSR